MTVNNNSVYVNNSSLFTTPDTTSNNAITMCCNPNGIYNSNANSNTVNLRVACDTTGFGFAILNCTSSRWLEWYNSYVGI